MAWVESEVAELKRLVEDTDLSRKEIAALLGKTKGMVSSKLWAMGLTLKDETWNAEREQALRELALAGRTAKDIAKELGNGITRNAVVSKAARMKISLNGDLKQRNVHGKHPTMKEIAERSSARYKPREREVPGIIFRHCQWPIGDPLEEGFHFCCQPVMEPKRMPNARRETRYPYCEAHCCRAYGGWTYEEYVEAFGEEKAKKYWAQKRQRQ